MCGCRVGLCRVQETPFLSLAVHPPALERSPGEPCLEECAMHMHPCCDIERLAHLWWRPGATLPWAQEGLTMVGGNDPLCSPGSALRWSAQVAGKSLSRPRCQLCPSLVVFLCQWCRSPGVLAYPGQCGYGHSRGFRAPGRSTYSQEAEPC